MRLIELLKENPWILMIPAVATYVVYKLHVYYRLRLFKGPFGCGFSDFLHTKAFLTLGCEKWYQEVNEKYGPIARIAPNGLITSSPELWMHMNAVRSPYKRSDWFYHGVRFKPGEDNVFTATDTQIHDRKRKQMFTAYAGKENPSLEPDIDLRLQDFINLIRDKYVSCESSSKQIQMNLGQKLQFLTLDIISTIGLGKPFGMLRADYDLNNYLKSIKEGLFIANIIVGTGLYWIMQKPWLANLLGAPSEKDASGFGKMMAVASQFVDERLKNRDAKSDMLAAFIRNGLAGSELKMEAFEQIAAGSETTAGGLQSIILCLMTNSRAYRKLQAEIDQAVRSEEIHGIITDAQARQLEYLQAVIREGLRLLNPVVMAFPRDVPPGGDTVTIDGKQVYLPGGTWVGYSAVSMHQSKEIYGEDAKVFRPERWLIKHDLEKLANMKKVNDLIFGYGRWRCLGQNVAKIELSKTIFELFRHFDFALVNPERPWAKINIMGMYSISDMLVTVTARS